MSTRPVHELEARWQRQWELDGTYRAEKRPDAERYFGLVEFPFPSGAGIHMGHARAYIPGDVYARRQRMLGKNVLFPIGWDAFGLPTENFAIKNKVRPQDATAQNVENFRGQLRRIGVGFDWSREVDTTDPAFFKWTQWQFLQFVKQGMAHKAVTEINWCPRCKIGLANEEAQGGVCERCGNPVEKREKSQWMIHITDYAERLIKDLDKVDYWEKIKAQQRNWIGKSEGATIRFTTEQGSVIEVFTTRPDTIFGVTYVVLAPEHALVDVLTTSEQCAEVEAYRAEAARTTDEQRLNESRPKSGVFTGGYAINPANQERVPVWIADYVLATYGTGAVMAVPAHDERDYAFAKTYALPMKRVVRPISLGQIPFANVATRAAMDIRIESDCFTGDGEAINSDFISGAPTWKAKEEMVAWLEETGNGARKTTYRLRDWVFSRQRYWGEPIPLVKCEACAQQKQKVLMIHGFEGSAQGNWFPWLKRELETQGFEVFAPTMSTSAHPVLEDWMKELAPFMEQLGDQDIIIGHSLGAKAALHLIERAQKKIGSVFLVASAIGSVSEEDWARFRADGAGADIDALRAFWDTPYNWDAITPLVSGKYVLTSDDDPEIRPYMHKDIPKGWFKQMYSGFGHFDAAEIPLLLDRVVRAKNTGWIPVPEDQLPLELPPIEAYTPSDDGESPLATMPEWFTTTCPRCGGPAKRETDTMPNWAGSSWYFLRYTDPKNAQEFASEEALKRWMPVQLYTGGMEHTTLHLLYSRFWHKFLFDLGYIPEVCGDEPYMKRRSQGIVLAHDGEKMSKSKGNVVNPDDVVKEFGADVLRTYILFMGPFDQPVPWDHNGIQGVRKFLDRVWNLYESANRSEETPELKTLYHQTVKKLTEGIDQVQFNTCVSQLMILTNAYQDAGGIPTAHREGVIQILAPFAPHLTEELWKNEGKEGSVHLSSWPAFDASALESDEYELVVQVNGKVRGKIRVARDIAEEAAREAVLANEDVRRWTEGKTIEKTVFVKGRLLSLMVK